MKFRLPFHSEVGPNPPNCALEGERSYVEVCFLILFHWVEGKQGTNSKASISVVGEMQS